MGFVVVLRKKYSICLFGFWLLELNIMVSNHIHLVAKERIILEQMVFVPGMHGWFNTSKSINDAHHVSKMKNHRHMVISTIAEKLVHIM